MKCSRDNCRRSAYCRTVCQYHYLLARRKGLDLPPVMERPSRAERFWSKVRKTPGCWLWTGARSPYGYGIFRFAIGGHSGGARLAHRAAWMLSHGHISDDTFVCHRCDNPPCVNPDHLFLGDADANAKDCVAKGRTPVGMKHGMRKLSDENVAAIRRRFANGEPRAQIAADYGVSHETVGAVGTRRRWKHLP